MTNYFYFDAYGKKQGPFSRQYINELAAKEVIVPDTLIEVEDSYEGEPSIKVVKARYICGCFLHEHPGLGFPKATPGFFDIGFTRFISNTWISVIWVILIIAHFLAAIAAIAYSSHVGSIVPFLIALFAVPISLFSCRLGLELEVIFFRIESNTRESKECLREIKELLAQK